MSEAFFVEYLPYCRESAERKAALREFAAKINKGDIREGWFCKSDSIEEIRESLAFVADEYWTLNKYAEACVIHPPESPIPYLVSGGKWIGDNSPSDSYDVMCELVVCKGLREILAKWAFEDVATAKERGLNESSSAD